MALIKRFGYFFIGLSFGILFLSFFFKGKNTQFCYFPNCRVLKDISKKEIVFSPEVNKLIENKTISKEQIKNILKNGDIIFSKSDTDARPCKKYILTGDTNEGEFEFSIDNCVNKAVIQSIKIVE